MRPISASTAQHIAPRTSVPAPGRLETHCPADLLKSRDFDVVPYAERYRALADRLGLEFSATIFALSHIPLCAQRPLHADMRRDMARAIAETQDAAQLALGTALTRFETLATPGPHDILNDIIRPGVSGLLSALCGIDLMLPHDTSVSKVFNQTIGVRKRRRMEAELQDILSRLHSAFPHDPDDRIGQRLALAILGNDALIGSVSNSLYHVFSAQGDRPLSDMSFGAVFPRTGVPYVDRVAVQPCQHAGQAIAAGGNIRARLDSYEAPDRAGDRMGFFGSGAHTCLGRHLSTALWAGISRCLGDIDRRVEIVKFAPRKDSVFRIPCAFRVSVA